MIKLRHPNKCNPQLAHFPGNNQLFEFWQAKKRTNNAVHQLLRRDRIHHCGVALRGAILPAGAASGGAGKGGQATETRVSALRKIGYRKYLDLIKKAATTAAFALRS